ncbi:MAG: molybdenum cofactor guanylyltransferase MobA [Janthinobacterium lividum]
MQGCVLLVLAGGQGTRMGGVDKPLRMLCGRPLLAHVLARLGQPAGATLLSVNDRPDRYQAFGATLLPDTVAGWPGPLAGILAGLEWLGRAEPGADLLVAPADTPFLPRDLLPRLRHARAAQAAGVACARSGGRLHPATGLWRAEHAAAVRQALAAGERQLGRVMQAVGLAVAEFDAELVDPFFNVNTPEELAKAEVLCRRQEARPEALPLDSAKGSPLESPS